MGNFPYPSTYILNGGGEMPAFPVRVACEFMKEENMPSDALLSAFADSLGIFYNYTKVRMALTQYPILGAKHAWQKLGQYLFDYALQHASRITLLNT